VSLIMSDKLSESAMCVWEGSGRKKQYTLTLWLELQIMALMPQLAESTGFIKSNAKLKCIWKEGPVFKF